MGSLPDNGKVRFVLKQQDSGVHLPDFKFSSVQFSSVTQLCPTLRPHELQHAGLPVHNQLSESTQIHAHRVGDVIQSSHPLSSPSPPALNLSQHQGPFK